MPKYCILFLVLGSFTPYTTYSQKAEMYVKLIDSSSSASEYIFNIEVKNISFDTYWVQDTSFLKNLLEHPAKNLIYPYLQKKAANEFKIYERYKYRPGVGTLAKCLDSCCNCIFLKRGESLKIDLPILECYIMEKGQYRMQVVIGPPFFSCLGCKQLEEICSKYVYFTVK